MALTFRVALLMGRKVGDQPGRKANLWRQSLKNSLGEHCR